jgi:hypothetical protein
MTENYPLRRGAIKSPPPPTPKQNLFGYAAAPAWADSFTLTVLEMPGSSMVTP